MPEAVIVDAVRTPIGRAFKGSLAQLRPDEMGAFIVDQLLERNEAVDPASVEEVVAGCGLPQGKQAFNIGRIIVLLSEKLPHRDRTARRSRATAPPGLDAIRDRREQRQGRPGRHLHRRRRRVGLAVQRAPGGGRRRRPEREAPGPRGRPAERLHPDGRDGGERGRSATRSAAPTWTSTRSARRSWPSRRRRTASSTARSSPVTLRRRHGRGEGRRPARELDAREALRAARGVPGRRRGHRRQLVPAERRRRGRADHVRREGEGARPQAARADHHRGDRRRTSPSTWASRRSGRSGRCSSAPGMTIDDVDTVELNEAFAAQVIPIMAECDIPLEKMNPHGGAIALGHPFGMTGVADHDDAAERPRDRRQDDRPRDDVRRRRSGRGDDRRAPELGTQGLGTRD